MPSWRKRGPRVNARHAALVGHGAGRHRVRAVQFLWVRPAPEQLPSLFGGVQSARCRVSGRDSVMSTLPPAEPIIAVDLTVEPKQIREGGYVPQSSTARRCMSVQ
jgi:hypothetical protein